MLNEYTGFELHENGQGIPSLDLNGSLPQTSDFFHSYIATRTPVVLKNYLSSQSHLTPSQWTLDSLKQTSSKVKVEQRDSLHNKFGTSQMIEMDFTHFIESLEKGEQNLYLTAQTSSNTQELLHAPLDQLPHPPVFPALLSPLIPHSCNLWAGNALSGSSSGLHHDYHDNLYVVLSGEKSFHLFSPSRVSELDTTGIPVRVHPNGLVNYVGYETRSDGALREEADGEDRRVAAEEEVSEAEKAVEREEKGAEERLATAEQKLEECLDSCLDSFICEEGDENDYDSCESDSNSDSNADKEKEEQPLSFSKIDQGIAHGLCTGAICTLKQGDALYLPASWFHEVVSRSANGTDTDSGSDTNSNAHLALNFWYHPPDNLNNWKQPYLSQFWARRLPPSYTLQKRPIPSSDPNSLPKRTKH